MRIKELDLEAGCSSGQLYSFAKREAYSNGVQSHVMSISVRGKVSKELHEMGLYCVWKVEKVIKSK